MFQVDQGVDHPTNTAIVVTQATPETPVRDGLRHGPVPSDFYGNPEYVQKGGSSNGTRNR